MCPNRSDRTNTRFIKDPNLILIVIIGVLVIGLCAVSIALGNLLYQSLDRGVAQGASPTHPLFTGPLPTEPPFIEPTIPAPGVATEITSLTPPVGKIVFACRREEKAIDDLCLMNADGSGYRRLTEGINAENYYPSLSPDGTSVVFSSNRTGAYQIFELDLESGQVTQLTINMGEAYGPEISPDGTLIVFANNANIFSSIWLMERDGANPRMIFREDGKDAVDPTWSPDGSRILFALGTVNTKQLFTMDIHGADLHRVSEVFYGRGRSDWSADGTLIGAYGGAAPHWEVFFMHPDGSNLYQMTYSGRNLAPGFSPDSKWMVYTSYGGDNANLNACEIYIMRVDGTENTRLTENEICDWQPRWGP